MDRRRRLLGLLAVLAAAFMLTGCIKRAEDEMPKVGMGMKPAQVKAALGQPDRELVVTLQGYPEPFTVWEYIMLPKGCGCPPATIARIVGGAVSLGASEQLYKHDNAKPHWIYFRDGEMVHKSLGLDCKAPACKLKEIKPSHNS